ncbi:MAG: Rab family GTPase [Candidatus Hermodarchaeota archaeon]
MGKYTFKVLLLGAPSVGKTSILYKYVRNEFSQDYITTIGTNFLMKDIKPDGKNRVELVIWDIAGHKRFRLLRKEFYVGTNGALVIFDLTRYSTFEEIEEWVSEMFEILEINIPFVLIGNKSDLIKEIGRTFENTNAKDYAEQYGSRYVETSAKTGENIEEAFKELANLMITFIKEK